MHKYFLSPIRLIINVFFAESGLGSHFTAEEIMEHRTISFRKRIRCILIRVKQKKLAHRIGPVEKKEKKREEKGSICFCIFAYLIHLSPVYV